MLSQIPKHSQTILDLGCGVGKFSRLLAEKSDRVIALDLSPKSIEIAKQKSARFNNINYRVADISQWQFPTEYFDVITSIATLHHLPLNELLPKLKTALKPEGTLLILDLLEQQNIWDTLNDCIAVPLNWWFIKTRNKHIEFNHIAAEAMREHLRTDKYLTYSQVKEIYTSFLKTPKVRRHLFWRYSVVWQKPMA